MDLKHDSFEATTQLPGSIVCNSKYTAHIGDQGVQVWTLDKADRRTFCLLDQDVVVVGTLALSSVLLNRLAVSYKGNIIIRDLDTGKASYALRGNGRIITALAWSPLDSTVLAAGCIDGSICIWDLSIRAQISQQLSYAGGICSTVTFSLHVKHVIASAHDRTIEIWSLSRPSKPIKTIHLRYGRVTSLAWHPALHGRLLSTSSDSVARVWDVTEALSAAQVGEGGDGDSDDDDGIFGGLDDIKRPTFPIAEVNYVAPLTTAAWIGEHGMFAHSCRNIHFYSFGADWEMLQEVWRIQLDFAATVCLVIAANGFTSLAAVAAERTQQYRIPSAVLDGVGGHAQPQPSGLSTGIQDFAMQQESTQATVSDNVLLLGQSRPQTHGMQPVSISLTRSLRGTFQHTSWQIKKERESRRMKSQKTASTAREQTSPPAATPATPVSQAMTSSLELPKPRDQDVLSPMPFLSPSIPSRKASPNTMPPVEDSLHLPPLQNGSFDSLPATAAQESDSDDETFAGDMRNSATYMPGGINVPLPKACGALFVPNGQLLTFFPPRPRPRSAHEGQVQDSKRNQDGAEDKARKIARLFPTFGNLTAGGGALDDDSESGSSEPPPLQHGDLNYTAQPYSYVGQSLWTAQSSPTKQDFAPQSEHKVIVCAHDLDGLLPSPQSVAGQYRILCGEAESGSALCLHNAKVAEGNDDADAASIWRLIGMILEDRVPLQAVAGSEPEILLVAKTATAAVTNGRSFFDVADSTSSASFGKLRWADGPFGGGWLIRLCLEWAESRADMQTLANLSAVLAQAEDADIIERIAVQQSITSNLLTQSPQYVMTLDGTHATPAQSRPIPILRTSSIPDGKVYESPIKLRQSSQASSTTHSNPLTPYFGSESSTPPLVFPSFSRQGTKLSISGSASPEHHRSSFSAAARQYAQSISDKFASYGTSPPTKKLSTSTSPSMNELSTSLPNGSWSKSVSFASTASTTRDSQLSKSYTTTGEGDGYDSDKTIDDSSLPHTPRSTNGPVAMTEPNRSLFADNVSGAAKVPLLSDELRTKGVLWRAHYSEQLRCWGLWMQAAEMEKVSGLTNPDPESSVPHLGIIPTRISGTRKPICSICTSVITKLQQLCPACLHSTHMACLQSYLECLDIDEAYECPTGCGCACASLPFEPLEISVAAEDEEFPEAAPRQPVRKKPSFTDPRWWHARMEGDSW